MSIPAAPPKRFASGREPAPRSGPFGLFGAKRDFIASTSHTASEAGLCPGEHSTPGNCPRAAVRRRVRAMSATTSHPPLRAVPFRAPTARLALKAVSPSPGHVELDGAWWPRSRDLTHELSALADVLDPLWGRITHVAV